MTFYNSIFAFDLTAVVRIQEGVCAKCVEEWAPLYECTFGSGEKMTVHGSCFRNPYAHDCVDHPRLLCPACEWADHNNDLLSFSRQRLVSNFHWWNSHSTSAPREWRPFASKPFIGRVGPVRLSTTWGGERSTRDRDFRRGNCVCTRKPKTSVASNLFSGDRSSSSMACFARWTF